MRFWLSRKGSTEGPFEESELAARIGSGELGGNDLVCPEGGQQWVAIASHSTLSAALSGSRPSRAIAPTMALSSEPITSSSATSSSDAASAVRGSTPIITAPPAKELTPTTVGSPEFAGVHGSTTSSPTDSSTAPGLVGTPVAARSGRNPVVLAVAGCAVLSLLSVCCAGTGTAVYFAMAGGTGIAGVVQEHVAEAFVAAIFGTDPSRAFAGAYATDDFTHSDGASVRATLAPVGGAPEVLFTALRFQADLTTAGQRHNVGGTIVVFPDGRVRYMELGHYALDSFVYEGGTDSTWVAVSEEESAVHEAVLDTLEQLGGTCRLEMLSPGDVSDLPTVLVSEVLAHASESERNEVCAEVLPLFAGRVGWEHVRLEQALVVVRGNDRVGALSAEFITAQHAFGHITGQMADVRRPVSRP